MEMAIIFLIIFWAAVGCNCQSDNPFASSSWAKLQISPDTLGSMEYGNFLIEIYEHANNHKATTTPNQKKYYYSPIALLDHKSANSTYNRVTKQSEMRFRIEMWNNKVQNEVVKHLNDVGHEVKSNKVTVIPFEKVILTSKRPTVDYSLSPEWTNYDKSKTLRLSLSCYDQKICDELANEMRSDPEQFDHFKLLYSLSSQTSQIKQTTISINSVTSGQMVTTLLQKFEDKKEIFLTANDEKKMLSETATNIRMDTFDDSEVGSPDTESQILNILKDLLVTSKATITKQSDKMWDSVFWIEDNYRPDKTTKTLNEIINKLDTETQKKLADMYQKAEKQSEITEKSDSSSKGTDKRREKQVRHENQTKDKNENEMRRSQSTDQEQSSRNQTRDDQSKTNKVDAEVSGGGFFFSLDAEVGVENNNTHNTEQENENREIAKKSSNEHNRNVENKERFQHNYDSNSWADVDRISSTISGKMAIDSDRSRRVEISEEDVEKLLQESRNHVQWDGEKFVPKPMQLSRINLGKFRDSQTFQDRNVRVRYTNAELSAPIKIMEHAELTVTDEWNNLKEELKDTRELLRTTVANLEKRSTELDNTRIYFTNKLEATNQKLAKTKIELEKSTADLRQTVDILTVKLNLTAKELTETNISAGNLSTELKATQKEMEATQRTLESTRIELRDTNSIVNDLSEKLNARTIEIADIGKIPTSCEDLNRMGHEISGIFLVKGPKKMEAVYCNFDSQSGNDKQKWIGYADVKSHPVHFYVQRNSTFETNGTPIPFDLAWVNEGNAMNLTSGVFTAPRTGTYFFFFTGVATFPVSAGRAQLGLHLNGGEIGKSVIEKANVLLRQWSVLSLQSTLSLKSGDQVWVQMDVTSWSYMYDSSDHLTHFTGFMLDEEIVESL
ncbi:probable E3 ubiquitin-protein ligase bre1 [Daphnia pulicaria]|uniref:probable E3 ubiquitin-protein ligase bre1 n=1 Tax=Daphnia pulicaria TaxID=35523 RepID=UPI001EEBD5DE|nr:probable E3 ubiquitin-protein ligase bre1 [Daphnia pulicaria]